MTYSISWDERKHQANRRKHGVSFFEAKELLESEVSVDEYYDFEHSVDEDRYQTLGPVRRGLIVVIWSPRGEQEARIISARFANRWERHAYERRHPGALR